MNRVPIYFSGGAFLACPTEGYYLVVLLVLLKCRQNLIRLTEDEEKGTRDIDREGAIPDVPTSSSVSVNDAVARLGSEYTAVRLDGEDRRSDADPMAREM